MGGRIQNFLFAFVSVSLSPPPPPFPGVWGRVVRVGAEGRALGSGKEW